MSNRHFSRTVAMQILFEWEFNHRSQRLQNLIDQGVGSDLSNLENINFVSDLVHGVTKNMSAIDEVIIKHAPEWPIDKIMMIDRNVLRIALYEMLYEKQAPPKVIINEAIELAKAFGSESSGKFVNGVLGAVYSELTGKKDKDNSKEKE